MKLNDIEVALYKLIISESERAIPKYQDNIHCKAVSEALGWNIDVDKFISALKRLQAVGYIGGVNFVFNDFANMNNMLVIKNKVLNC